MCLVKYDLPPKVLRIWFAVHSDVLLTPALHTRGELYTGASATEILTEPDAGTAPTVPWCVAFRKLADLSFSFVLNSP